MSMLIFCQQSVNAKSFFRFDGERSGGLMKHWFIFGSIGVLAGCSSFSQNPETCKTIAATPGAELHIFVSLEDSQYRGSNTSFEQLECRARHGDKQAQYAVAMAFERGEYMLTLPENGEMLQRPIHVAKDITKAIRWYKRAAAFVSGRTSIWVPGAGSVPGHVMSVDAGPDVSGHVPAMVRLGTIYMQGIGVPVDSQKAYRVLSRAAKTGDARAARMLRELEKAV
jgi:TPR repeat protein